MGGLLVTVEGPYGRFGFNSEKPRQIWVAGGIGIAPFAARIKALINESHDVPIDLFYTANEVENNEFMSRTRVASKEANVRLHLVEPAKNGRLDADQICQMIPEWKEAEFWFCGPASFGQSLQRELVSKGLPEDAFHRELFDMR